jgi:hypothetical protein
MLACGSIFAEESSSFPSRTSTKAESDFTLGHGGDQMAEYAIDERILDRLGLFDLADTGRSPRYNLELELENEDSDWSFEVTVTVEF